MARVRYARLARVELYEAVDYYAREASAEVADSFYDDIQAAAHHALSHPHVGELHGRARRVRCHTFPYYVYYHLMPYGIRVVAIRHQKRRSIGRLPRR